MSSKHQRAKPLPPAERQDAIVEAIIPLLLDKGSAVTSREIAEAAGVAEGTIFSVFPDKAAVIKQALETTMDPAPVCAALTDISEFDSLEAQLEAAATVLFEHSERIAALMGILRSTHQTSAKRPRGIPSFVHKSNAATLAGLEDLFERHSDRLRVPPERAAIAFRGLIFANAHPMVGPHEKTTPQEIVDLLLRGVAEAPA